MTKCSVEGCENRANLPGSARDLCRGHYRRWQRYGTELEPLRKVTTWSGEKCTVRGCGRPVVTHGFCVNHYAVARRKANPEAQRIRMRRFKAKQEQLLVELAGRPRPHLCELCEERGVIAFDHCHSSGQFRGWLCQRCNRTLGQVKDNCDLLQKMIQWIKTGGKGHGSIGEPETRKVINLC